MEHTPLHETKLHGIPNFPYTVYCGSIPAWFSSFPLHWHDDFELIYCASGQIQVTLWGQVYILRAGDLIVILPHGVHSIEQAGTESGDYFNIMFHPSLFASGENDPCYEKYVLPFLNGGRTMSCFHPADTLFNQDVTPCDQKVSVQRAAEQCGFSSSHFMKLFKEFTGMSFNAYLVNYRLDLAAKQLSETNLKVIEIAENCGFHNQSYFTRMFRKKYQKTPLAYRADTRSDG